MTKVLTPIKAIRAKCLECSCGQAVEVRLCVLHDCPLYPYRMGHRPTKAAPAEADDKSIEECERDEKTAGFYGGSEHETDG